MTGTALTEEQEFRDIYGMDVIEIPTNKPVARIDYDDAVYMTKKEKVPCCRRRVKESHGKISRFWLVRSPLRLRTFE